MALDFGKLNFSVSFNPTSAFPLDARSYFESYADAEAAAAKAEAAGSTDSVYYYGQTLVVIEDSVAKFYIIQPNKTLSAVVAGEIPVDKKLFVYDKDGNLSLKGFDTAATGSLLSLGEDGTLSWISMPTNVYTKTETDELIAAAVAKAPHLKRRIVANIAAIETYMANNDDADQYIFMVPAATTETHDKYDEYLVLELNGVKSIEKVGSWEIDLSGYATIDDLSLKVDKEEGSRLITAEEAQKLANLAAQGYITGVDESYFMVVDGVLYFLGISINDVSGLRNALNKKVDAIEGWTLLGPDDKEKLEALVVNQEGQLELSGVVNASNVQGLTEWMVNNSANCIMGLDENNFSDKIVTKLNYISSVDSAYFTVDNSVLKFQPQAGRLITAEEADILAEAMSGTFNNYVKSVDTSTFKVQNGRLSLIKIPETLLHSTVGDLTQLLTYNENPNTTIVDEINNLYTIVSWQDIVK